MHLTNHHVAVYNGKLVPMDYVPSPKQEFMIAAFRIADNGFEGHVITPKGEVFFIPKGEARKNRRLPPDEARAFLEKLGITVVASAAKTKRLPKTS